VANIRPQRNKLVINSNTSLLSFICIGEGVYGLNSSWEEKRRKSSHFYILGNIGLGKYYSMLAKKRFWGVYSSLFLPHTHFTSVYCFTLGSTEPTAYRGIAPWLFILTFHLHSCESHAGSRRHEKTPQVCYFTHHHEDLPRRSSLVSDSIKQCK
jgi:hypothetical protein